MSDKNPADAAVEVLRTIAVNYGKWGKNFRPPYKEQQIYAAIEIAYRNGCIVGTETAEDKAAETKRKRQAAAAKAREARAAKRKDSE